MDDTLAGSPAQDSVVQPLRPARGKLTVVFLVTIVVGAIVGYGLRAPDTQSGPMVGEIAPEVVADLFEGGGFTLSDHLATDRRPLVLNLWASWCPECIEEFPALSTFAESNPEIAVIGVSVNDRASDARAFWETMDPTFPVGSDVTDRLRDSYPGFGLPVTFVIDETGRVTHQIDGTVTVALLESLFR